MADDDNEQRSPFARRGFIAAAGVVAVIAILGITLGIVNATRDDPDPDPTGSSSSPTTPTSTSAAPTSEPTEAAGGVSVCGLDDGGDAERLSTAPAVDQWDYEGTSAYPTSSEFGPGATDDTGGYGYCFQRSPEGALFAASYAAIVGSNPEVAANQIEYIAAPGPFRDELLSTATGDSTDAELRLRISGFRLLSYDGESANVDVAVTATVDGQPTTLSIVYPLVWVDGDWKISTESPDPGSVAGIPDLAGYVTWGE